MRHCATSNHQFLGYHQQDYDNENVNTIRGSKQKIQPIFVVHSSFISDHHGAFSISANFLKDSEVKHKKSNKSHHNLGMNKRRYP
jgi:hypothetical protein